MPPSTSARGPSTSSGEPSLARARALLAEALEMLDELRVPPELGARLQYVIDCLDEDSRRDRS